MAISAALIQQIIGYQRNEITEYHIYRRLARRTIEPENRRILEQIAEDERHHYNRWKYYTGTDAPPRRLRIWWFYWISRIFGLTFGIKLMEKGEESTQENYTCLLSDIPEAKDIIQDESSHEVQLIGLLEEEKLQYVGSVVLGLNDALVELTGALAGLTFALQDTRLIVLTGSIMGIAAALSMAASEYLSTKSETTRKSPVKASLYTVIAYILTVILLILPFLIFDNLFISLGGTLLAALGLIAFFNYYIAVVRDDSFRLRFQEMALLSFGVAAVSFAIGWGLRFFLTIEL